MNLLGKFIFKYSTGSRPFPDYFPKIFTKTLASLPDNAGYYI